LSNQEKDIVSKTKTVKAIGSLFSYKWIVKNTRFFLFLAGLTIIYIANGHMADNTIRRINDTQKELKDLQYEYKTLKSEVMFLTKESELKKMAEPLGFMMDTLLPITIPYEMVKN
jgi:hypothetical protein